MKAIEKQPKPTSKPENAPQVGPSPNRAARSLPLSRRDEQDLVARYNFLFTCLYGIKLGK